MEFKTLVRELHRNGIEVVLDVVFNHSGEGAWGVSNWNCLAKVAVSHWDFQWFLIKFNRFLSISMMLSMVSQLISAVGTVSILLLGHYYLMSNGYHTNYTGCGNTLLLGHQVLMRNLMINLDGLWAMRRPVERCQGMPTIRTARSGSWIACDTGP